MVLLACSSYSGSGLGYTYNANHCSVPLSPSPGGHLRPPCSTWTRPNRFHILEQKRAAEKRSNTTCRRCPKLRRHAHSQRRRSLPITRKLQDGADIDLKSEISSSGSTFC
ncbi:hypothetical protein CRENBAI_006607 [Crenichthys baileyi]|uniref:Uncharacterized protein n=1 Tax=Crenichthys baileyi TaxID=28760 RepID=A0AAV9QNY0_9TELE